MSNTRDLRIKIIGEVEVIVLSFDQEIERGLGVGSWFCWDSCCEE